MQNRLYLSIITSLLLLSLFRQAERLQQFCQLG